MPKEVYAEPSKSEQETKKPILKIVKNVHEIENINQKDKASCAHGYVYS